MLILTNPKASISTILGRKSLTNLPTSKTKLQVKKDYSVMSVVVGVAVFSSHFFLRFKR